MGTIETGPERGDESGKWWYGTEAGLTPDLAMESGGGELNRV
jgi:hypothetical protein